MIRYNAPSLSLCPLIPMAIGGLPERNKTLISNPPVALNVLKVSQWEI